MGWLIAAVIICILGGGAWWLAVRDRRSPERDLQRACWGNGAQASRLIEYELQRTPGISRKEAASRALQSHKRDNR